MTSQGRDSRSINVILLGPPGTGKGTQAKLIAERLCLAHISTGDMFRDAVAKATELGKRAKSYMDRGELVPDEVTIGMLEERLREPDAEHGAVFDGYPRTLTQAIALDAALTKAERIADLALLITASDEEIIRRLSGRWLCNRCGAIYHDASRPPKQDGVCDKCGGPLSQREDDKPEVVRERLAKQRPTPDLVAHYRNRSILVEVDGGQEVDTVTRELLSAIEERTGVAARAS